MSLRRERILKSLDQAYNGPVCTVAEWDNKIIPNTVRTILKKHRLENTCNEQEPINYDDDLADQFYKAGYEMALELGLLNVETERIIKMDACDLQEALKQKPYEYILGTGNDTVTLRPRKPEDPRPPLMAASLAICVSEEIYVPMVTGIVKYRKLVDILDGPSLTTVYGREIRSGTPYETLAGRYEVQLRQEALWRAGRTGMSHTGIQSAVTEYGHLGGGASIGGQTNTTKALCPVELKTSLSVFHKAAMAVNYDTRLLVGASSHIGGYAGPPEGAALANIATDLLFTGLLYCDIVSNNVFDIYLFGNCGRKALWANSIARQAISRNTNIITNPIVNETAGPCTETFFYESAVGLMNHCVSGASKTLQPRSAGGKYTDYITPMEAWWCGEVFKSCAGMTRKQANEIAKQLLPKYEDKLTSPPKGSSVYECFDLQTLEPKQEYYELYLRVRNELIELGIPLNKVYES